MGVCSQKTVCITAYYNEQDYGIVIVPFAFNIVFCRSEIQLCVGVLRSNIRRNSGMDSH